MRKDYILVLDSGVGGLSVLKELIKACNGQRFLYFGDNLNAPYGNKSTEELLRLTINNIEYAKRFRIKGIVLACNTLSVNVLDEIKKIYNLPVFGVFPPVYKGKGKAILLATPLTCKKYQSNNVCVYPLNDLAKDIEDNLFNLSNLKIERHIRDINDYFDTVILGCTHYELIKNKIIDHLKPQKTISGVKLCVDEVSKYYNNQKSLVKYKRNRVLFIGKFAKINKRFFNKVVKRL